MTSIDKASDNPARPAATKRRAGPLAPGILTGQQRFVRHAMAAAGACAAALAFGLWLGGNWPLSELTQLLHTDAATAWGLPISRLGVDLSAVGTVGMLVIGILLPRDDGGLSDVARRCLRSASWLALVWAATALALLLFAWSDITHVAVTQLPFSQIFEGEASSFPEGTAYLFGAVLAMIISAGASVTETRRGAVILLLLAVYNLLPLTTTGHAQHSRVIGLAVTMHVVALTLWIGGLAGLLIHVRRSQKLLAVVVPRFSTLALACFIAVGASGVTVAWLNLEAVPELWRSRYGFLVMFKVTALVALGIFGWWHRRRTVRAIVARRSRRAFVTLAAGELVVMATTIALGVALSRTPSPATAPEPMFHGAPVHQPVHHAQTHVS